MNIYFFDQKSPEKIWREAKKSDIHMHTCKFVAWIPKNNVDNSIIIIDRIGLGTVHSQMRRSFLKYDGSYKEKKPNAAGLLHFSGKITEWYSTTLNIQTSKEFRSSIQESLMSLFEK